MYSTNYIIGFVVAMTSLVAVSLTTLREVTKDQALLNEAIFNKRSILKAVNNHLGEKGVDDLSDEEVLNIFDNQIKQTAINVKGDKVESTDIIASGYKTGKVEDIDMAKEKKKSDKDMILPLYTYTANGKTFYILSVRGSGLWDEIWGCVALEDDLNTVVGASFDHKGETPGLGAEIKDNPVFAKNFANTKIYDEKGNYKSIKVRKGGAKASTKLMDCLVLPLLVMVYQK